MSLLLGGPKPADPKRAISVPWVDWSKGDQTQGPTESGEVVTEKTVLGVAAAWSCATLLADVVSSQPVHEYRKTSGVRIRIEPESLIIRKPSVVFTRREWVFQAVMAMAIHGNAIGEITQREPSSNAAAGWPQSVEWITHEYVRIEQKSPTGRPSYTFFNQPVDYSNVVHLRRYPQTGSAMGLSPLDIHTELFGVAQAARKYAAQWFGGGGVPMALLVNDNPIDETVANIAKERWLAGARGRQVRTLGSGWKYEKVQSTPGDSELTDTWNRVGLEVAQAFRIPPEMIGVATQGSSVTYANREQRAVDFLTFTVEPWLTIFEDWWYENLPRPRFAKFNTGNLLRSDLTTRYKAHDIAIRMGLVTVNERRALEDLPPVDGGDVTLWPPYTTIVQPTP